MNVSHASSDTAQASSGRGRVVLLGGASAVALGLTAVIAATVLSGKTDVPAEVAPVAAAPVSPAPPAAPAPSASARPSGPPLPVVPAAAPQNPFLPLVEASVSLPLPSLAPSPMASASPSASVDSGRDGRRGNGASPSATTGSRGTTGAARSVSGTVELHNLPLIPGSTPHCGAARLVHEVRVRAAGQVDVGTLSKTGTVFSSGPKSRAWVRFSCRFQYTVQVSSTGQTAYVFEVVRRTPYASTSAKPVSPSSVAGGKGPSLRLG